MPDPIPMLLNCPSCGARHIDQGEFSTKPHHTHACQSCGMVWRPAIEPTVGVQFLPGFKDDDQKRGILDPDKLDVKKVGSGSSAPPLPYPPQREVPFKRG